MEEHTEVHLPHANFIEVGDTVALADSGLLERVLANLIDNALRYAPW